MKKFVFTGLLVSLLALCGMDALNCAQEAEQPQAQPVPEETSVVAQPEPELWNEFKTVQGGFAIDLPAEPAVTKSTIYTWVGAADEFTFSAALDSFLFIVRYHDYQDADLIGSSPMVFLDSAVVMKSRNGQLVLDKMISVARHPGREFELVRADGSVQLSRIYLARERLFEITTILPSGLTPDTTISDIEEFFTSFRLL